MSKRRKSRQDKQARVYRLIEKSFKIAKSDMFYWVKIAQMVKIAAQIKAECDKHYNKQKGVVLEINERIKA